MNKRNIIICKLRVNGIWNQKLTTFNYGGISCSEVIRRLVYIISVVWEGV